MFFSFEERSISLFISFSITNAGLEGQINPKSQWMKSHLGVCKSSSNSDLGSNEELDSLLSTFVFAVPQADRTDDSSFCSEYFLSSFLKV